MIDIESGHELWTADTGRIYCVIASSNGSIYASAFDRMQFLKINPETGDITELFPIEGRQLQIVQYRLSHSSFAFHPDRLMHSLQLFEGPSRRNSNLRTKPSMLACGCAFIKSNIKLTKK